MTKLYIGRAEEDVRIQILMLKELNNCGVKGSGELINAKEFEELHTAATKLLDFWTGRALQLANTKDERTGRPLIEVK